MDMLRGGTGRDRGRHRTRDLNEERGGMNVPKSIIVLRYCFLACYCSSLMATGVVGAPLVYRALSCVPRDGKDEGREGQYVPC